MITEEAKEITEGIYRAYGSSSGWLFGINPDHKESVKAIVQCTIDQLNENNNNQEN